MLLTTRRSRFSIANLRSQSCSLHQVMHTINTALLANIMQISMEFAVSIDATRLKPKLFELAYKSFIVTLSLRLCAAPPRVIPARMNIKQLTQMSHRVAVMMLLDKGVSYSGWLVAKYAAAFFNRSRSSVTRLSSFCNRRISADSTDF